MLKLSKLTEIADKRPKKIAVIDSQKRVTFADLVTQVRNLTHYFSQMEFKRGAFLARNSVDLVAIQGAFATLGVPLVGLDYTRPTTFLIDAVSELDADVLVFDSAFFKEAEVIASAREIVSYEVESVLRQAAQAPAKSVSVQPRPFESIAFTSGTTGPAKATLRTSSFDERRFARLTEIYGFSHEDRFIATLPFYHVSVLGWARLFLNHGATIVISNVNSPDEMLVAMHDAKVTCALAVPHMVQMFVDFSEKLGIKPPLRFLITGGRHLPRDLVLRVTDTFGPILSEYYGTTETGLNAIARPEDLTSHPSSSGVIQEGNDIITVDSSFRPLPNGTVGRLAVYSYQNMEGYLNGRDSLRVKHSGRSYLVTSDHGVVRDGRLYIYNRTFRGSSLLDAYSIEDALRRLPCVSDAFVHVLTEDSIDVFVSGNSISNSVESVLSRLGYGNAQIHHVNAIPYSLTGKVSLAALGAV